MPEADLGDEFLEPEPPIARCARATEILVDHRHRRGRPPQFDRSLSKRVLPRARLMVAFQLRRGRLPHIHDRSPVTVLLGDLLELTHRAPPPPAAASSRASLTATCSWRSGGSVSHTAAGTTVSSLHRATRAVPTSSPPFSPEARRRAPDDAPAPPAPTARPTTATPPGGRPPDRRTQPEPPRQIRPPRRDRPPSCHPAAGTSAPSRPSSVATRAPRARHPAIRPARRPDAPAPAEHRQHE